MCADFLSRCQRHDMKVFYFLQDANPLAGGSVKAIQQQIEAAGIKDHPAIFAWELSWEPIYRSWETMRGGPKAPHTELLIPAWNAWIAERYGSLDNAEREWNYRLPRMASSQAAALLPMPCSAGADRGIGRQRPFAVSSAITSVRSMATSFGRCGTTILNTW